MSEPERRYSDAEVRSLLRRASSMQQVAPAPPRQDDGLTFGEIASIAAEAQIDVDLLKRAAWELASEGDVVPKSSAHRFAGAPFRLQVARTLPFESDVDTLGSLDGAISAFMGEPGNAQLIGRVLLWRVKAASGRQTDVRITVRAGSTHVQIEERYGELAGGIFGGILGGIGGGGGIGAGSAIGAAVGSAALGMAVPLLVIGGTYAACRAGYKTYATRRAVHIRTVCDDIVRHLASSQDAPRVGAP